MVDCLYLCGVSFLKILRGNFESINLESSGTGDCSWVLYHNQMAEIIDFDFVFLYIFVKYVKQLDEADAEEDVKVDEGGAKCEYGGDLGEMVAVERSRVVDLLTPAVEQKVYDIE